MAAAISPATGRGHGVARVCDGFGPPFIVLRMAAAARAYRSAAAVAPRSQAGDLVADHFQKTKFWGMAASFAFVGEPETNGVAERFFRTFKEQVVRRPRCRAQVLRSL